MPQKTGELMSEDVDEVLFSLDQTIKALHNIKADPRSDVLFAIGAAASRLEQTRDFIMKSRGIGYSQEAAALGDEDIDEQERVRNQKVL